MQRAGPGALPSPALGWEALVQSLGWALAAYTLFGLGYIGYMTFVIALLRLVFVSRTFTLGTPLLALLAPIWMWVTTFARMRRCVMYRYSWDGLGVIWL